VKGFGVDEYLVKSEITPDQIVKTVNSYLE
jgi:hypothetical protein